MKSVLITGGSGALGNALVERLLGDKEPSRIVVYSRGEYQQFLMRQRMPVEQLDRLRFMIGDVRDEARLRRAMEGVDTVIHAAALKRIEVGNYNPIEMVKTNVGGAISVIEASHDAGVKKVVGISSDKAWQPVSPYGTSKALAESIFLAANNTTGWKGPKFSVCRYGNVWGSTGSVVPIWQALRDDWIGLVRLKVPVTHPDCTRFFMRMEEAVDLILKTVEMAEYTKPVIPILPAYRLGDLAEAMGLDMDIRGLPPWEKLHEGMEHGNTSDKARRMTVEELRAEL
jgi:UDP-N-acetylglucosamine 4,6-dehydratase